MTVRVGSYAAIDELALNPRLAAWNQSSCASWPRAPSPQGDVGEVLQSIVNGVLLGDVLCARQLEVQAIGSPHELTDLLRHGLGHKTKISDAKLLPHHPGLLLGGEETPGAARTCCETLVCILLKGTRPVKHGLLHNPSGDGLVLDSCLLRHGRIEVDILAYSCFFLATVRVFKLALQQELVAVVCVQLRGGLHPCFVCL